MKITTEFVDVVCCVCGVHFGIEDEHDDNLRRTKRSFFCTNGHEQHYRGKSHEEEIKALNARLARQLSELDQVSADRDFHARSAASYKGKLNRTKTRLKNGVCPCCNRHFKDLERHMKGQHPDYQPEGESK